MKRSKVCKTKTMDNLTQLINSALEGNENARSQIYKEYFLTMTPRLKSILPCMNDVQDVIHEAYIKAITKLHQFDLEQGKFRAWTFRIAVNEAFKLFNSTKKEVLGMEALSGVRNVSDSVYDKLELQEATRKISRLPKQQKTAIFMHQILGYSHREIANELGINEGTSRSNLFKARLKLRD